MPGNWTIFSFLLLTNLLSDKTPGQDRVSTGTGSYQKELAALKSAIDRNFYDSAAGYYKEWPGADQPRHPYTYLWSLCALFQADNEIEKLEPHAKLLQPLLSMIRDYEDPAPPQPGFADYIRKFTGGERYYDDNQWLGITALDAYARTKDSTYLSLGHEIYTFMMTGYDTVLSGGLYWKENRKTSKNTCSNGPGILVALQLYEATKDHSYLDTALLLYRWVNKTLKAPSGLYYDNMTIKGRISTPILSYNTGTMLESNLYLYECTDDKSYLQQAVSIADSSLPYFYGGIRFRDSYWFNAVLLRGYQHLLRYDKDTKYILGFKKCLDYALQNEKNDQELFAEKGKDLDLVAHGGMLEMLARFAWMEKQGILTHQQ
jgi:hypothetical protein